MSQSVESLMEEMMPNGIWKREGTEPPEEGKGILAEGQHQLRGEQSFILLLSPLYV